MVNLKKYGSLHEDLRGLIDSMNYHLDKGELEQFEMALLYYIQRFPLDVQEEIAGQLGISAEELEDYLTDPELKDTFIDDIALYIIIDACGLEVVEESRKNPVKYYYED